MAPPLRDSVPSGSTASSTTERPVLDARFIALQALVELDDAHGRRTPRADDVVDRLLRMTPLDARDRGLAWELVFGVLRYRLSLDWRLAHVADRPLDRLPSIVRAALRLGAYQLLYLTRVPPSAAVNESVRLVKSKHAARGGATPRPPGRDWSGFVNAVLRGLLRKASPAIPDLDADPIAALSLRYSAPEWLTRRWIERLGVPRAEQLCRQTVEIPPVTIRTNVIRTGRPELERALRDAGYEFRPARVSPVGLVLKKGESISPVVGLPEFRAGWFYIEDEAAQLVPLLLDPRPGERILDACAAPGGKTTHLAAQMENRGEIIAVDKSAIRLQLLEDNGRRLGVEIIRTVVADAAHDLRGSGAQLFDRILVDAPCSSLGVLRRHPEAKWYRQPLALSHYQASQLKILKMAAKRLRPRGVLVYSTCSTEPEENEDVIEEFCRTEADFRRESVGSFLPAHARDLVTAQGYFSTALNSDSMDGFFAARLRRMS
jgi:16S rRNA (cytosine967-C5)-methyltransferase